jgi:hypothetical protein
MMPTVSPRAGKVHLTVTGASGLDMLVLFVVSLGIPGLSALALRVVALKVLRHFKVVGESLWRAFWSPARYVTANITFEHAGVIYELVDTRGATVVR